MKRINVKKLVLLNPPYVFLGLYASKLGQVWRLAAGADASKKLLYIMDGFAAAFQSALPSFRSADLVVGLLCGAALGVWGVINLMEGYGNDNPGANAHVR